MLKENKMNNFDRAEKACYERLKNQNKKTDREIELEKKLKIAVKALKKYANRKNWQDIELYDMYCFAAQFKSCGYEIAEKALKEIEK